MALQNMHALLLKKKGVERADCSGGGTGHSLTIKKHYATEVRKRKNKTKRNSKGKTQFVYSFKLMDLNSRMYVGSNEPRV